MKRMTKKQIERCLQAKDWGRVYWFASDFGTGEFAPPPSIVKVFFTRLTVITKHKNNWCLDHIRHDESGLMTCYLPYSSLVTEGLFEHYWDAYAWMLKRQKLKR